MPKTQFSCTFLQVIGSIGLIADKFANLRYNFYSQTLTVYSNWWSYNLITPQVVIIVQAGSIDHWYYSEDNHFFPGNWQYLGAGSLPLQRVTPWILAKIHWNYLVDSIGRTLEGILRDVHATLLEHPDVGSLPSQHFITPNLHASAGVTASFDVQNIKNSIEKVDICSSWCQVSKECSVYQACLAHLMHDVVNSLPWRLRFIVVTDIKDGQQYLLSSTDQAAEIFSLPMVAIDTTQAEPTAHRASIEHLGVCLLYLWNFILLNFHAVIVTCVETIRLYYEWAISILQDFNCWKESSNVNSSSHQAGKECSFYQVFSACLMPDAVNIPISKSSVRLLETRRYIGISKEAPDIPSSWHPACLAGFMPDAGNIPLLEDWQRHSESQKNYVQMLHEPLPSADPERQPNDPLLEDYFASQSHILESYFHPGITTNSCHQACAASLMPKAREILDLGSGADIFQPQKLLISVHQDRMPDDPVLVDLHGPKSHVLETYPHPEMNEIGTLPSPAVKRMTCVGEVGQKCRAVEAMDRFDFSQGFLTVLRDLTDAVKVSILGIEAWIYVTKRHLASLVDHDGKPHCPQGYQRPHLEGSMEVCKSQDMYVLGICLALSKFAIELRSNFPAHIPAHDNPWSMEVLRLGQLSPALWASVRVKPIRTKGGKRTQTVMGRSIVAHTATKITGNSPNRASEGAKDPPSGER